MPCFMSDEQAVDWWNELGVHNIIIKHPIQTQKKKIQLFTEENLEYQGEPKHSILCKIIMFNQNKPVALDVHSKHQIMLKDQQRMK